MKFEDLKKGIEQITINSIIFFQNGILMNSIFFIKI